MGEIKANFKEAFNKIYEKNYNNSYEGVMAKIDNILGYDNYPDFGE